MGRKRKIVELNTEDYYDILPFDLWMMIVDELNWKPIVRNDFLFDLAFCNSRKRRLETVPWRVIATNPKLANLAYEQKLKLVITPNEYRWLNKLKKPFR